MLEGRVRDIKTVRGLDRERGRSRVRAVNGSIETRRAMSMVDDSVSSERFGLVIRFNIFL